MHTPTKLSKHSPPSPTCLRWLPQGAPARVVALTSFGHNFSKGLPMDDLNWETRPYSAWPAYGQSKLSNALFAVELARRWALR
jgi:NAD(P)-dependent dehydrogenase (short-subunit alcohol dehydrogenase family)